MKKKRTVALSLVILLVVLLLVMLLIVSLLTAGSADTTIITSTKDPAVHGHYFLFTTENVQEYLNFLEVFDETKYEIVNISTSMSVTLHGSNEFYMITYKVLSDTE